MEFAASESLVREALCGRIDPPPAGPLTATVRALRGDDGARAQPRVVAARRRRRGTHGQLRRAAAAPQPALVSAAAPRDGRGREPCAAAGAGRLRGRRRRRRRGLGRRGRRTRRPRRPMRRVSGRRTRPSEYASWKWRFPRSRSDFPLRRTRPSRNDGRGPRSRPTPGRRRIRSRSGCRSRPAPRAAARDPAWSGPSSTAALQRGRACLSAGPLDPSPVRLPRRRSSQPLHAAEARLRSDRCCCSKNYGASASADGADRNARPPSPSSVATARARRSARPRRPRRPRAFSAGTAARGAAGPRPGRAPGRRSRVLYCAASGVTSAWPAATPTRIGASRRVSDAIAWTRPTSRAAQKVRLPVPAVYKRLRLAGI